MRAIKKWTEPETMKQAHLYGERFKKAAEEEGLGKLYLRVTKSLHPCFHLAGKTIYFYPGTTDGEIRVDSYMRYTLPVDIKDTPYYSFREAANAILGHYYTEATRAMMTIGQIREDLE